MKTILLAGALFFVYSGYCQSPAKSSVRPDNGQLRQRPLKNPAAQNAKPNSKIFENSSNTRALNPQPLPPVDNGTGKKALNPQPLPPIDGQSKMKGLNPQPEPPGKIKRNKVNTLNPQPLLPKEDKPAANVKMSKQ